MTVQKSSSKLAVNYKLKLKSNNKYMVLLFILHMLAGPLFLTMSIITSVRAEKAYNLGKHYSFNSIEIYITIAVITTLIAAICGIVIALNNFNYLFKKSNVDMVFALPMTRNQRFFSDYLSGLTAYVVPFWASSVFTVILAAVLNHLSKIYDVFKETGYFDSDIVIMKYVLMGIFFGTLLMIMLYTLSVFTTTFSGSRLSAVANVIALNIIIPLFIITISSVFIGRYFGMVHSYAVLPYFLCSSPFGGVIFAISYFTGEGAYMSFFGTSGIDVTEYWMLKWLLPFIIIVLAMLIGAFLLNRKRKAENVSKPYPFNIFYYIIMALATFIIASIFSLSSDKITDVIIPAIIVLAVVWLVISVALNKGFKNILKTAVQFVITAGIILSVIVINDKTTGFGAVYKVPELNKIKSIEVVYNGINDNVSDAYNFNSHWQNKQYIKYTDRDIIELFRQTHKNIVDKYKENHNNNYAMYGSNTFSIVYNLKGGNTLKREYNIDSEELQELTAIEHTTEYIDKKFALAEKNINKHIINKGHFAEIYLTDKLNAVYNENQNKINIKTKANLHSLLEAMSTDLKSLTDEQYYKPEKKVLGILSCYNIKVYVNEDYKNTLKWLNDNNVSLPDFNSYNDIYNDMTICKVDNDGKSYSVSSMMFDGDQRNIKVSKNIPEDLKTLIDYAQPYFVSDNCKYLFSICGINYAIPEKYNSIAEKYYEND